MRFIDELRAKHADAVGRAFEIADEMWKEVKERMESVAKNGGKRIMAVFPKVPVERAGMAAMLVSARAEGFEVTKREIKGDTVWEISWR